MEVIIIKAKKPRWKHAAHMAQIFSKLSSLVTPSTEEHSGRDNPKWRHVSFSALSWLYPAHRPGLQLRRGPAEFRNQRGEWYSISMLSLPETTETNRALASVRGPRRPNKAQTQLSIFLTHVRTERENMCLSSILSWNSYLHFKVGRGELCFADKREQTADRKQSSVASFLQERAETWNSPFFHVCKMSTHNSQVSLLWTACSILDKPNTCSLWSSQRHVIQSSSCGNVCSQTTTNNFKCLLGKTLIIVRMI